MRYIKKLVGKLPYSGKRRRVAHKMQRLWKPTVLAKEQHQSNGQLYEYFLSNTEKDIYKWHHYFDIYEKHLGKFVGTPVRFLEIGVLNGGSIRMWRDYFGTDATIVGIDIDSDCSKYDGKHGAVRIGDQTDDEFLASVCEEFGPFDVVLDDGGHNPSQQIASFSYLYPTMSENGLYLCEDTQTNFWPKRQDLGRKTTFVNLANEAARRLSEPHYERSHLKRFAEPPGLRQGEFFASYIAAATFGVYFYDSIIVLEKRKKAEPWHEIR